MTPFVTRCALAGGLATALVLAIALTASGWAYDADHKALRSTYGSTLAEQLAASAIDPLLANEALQLTSLSQEMSQLSRVPGPPSTISTGDASPEARRPAQAQRPMAKHAFHSR